ncbi:MAG: hypothetical protein Q8916_00580 [Bacteroidota bacterium]|nr:hypothetical protein [Bacteroidota bacterium]MDP4228881.1 hypothetical protein [Bacteroidota bacterium]MDP4234954.1 hypothetical protein [Bacteroidota bacterium]
MTYKIFSAILFLSAATASFAQDFAKYPIVVTPIPGNINTSGNDYAPVIGPDRSVLFTSFERNGEGSATGQYSGKPDGNVSALTIDGTSIEGAMSIAADGKTVVFAAHRSDAIGDADLYIGELSGTKIINVANLGPKINTKGWESHPCISSDGSVIYFSSDRKGGYGRTDIWMTKRDGAGFWGEPVNLGPSVNTSKDERSPFITPDGGTLYFSSKGHHGNGGYDVFMSMKKGATWSDAVNLGPVINSDRDELFFYAPKSSGTFYFSSSREGGKGGLDIYSGTPNIYGSGMTRLVISFIDSASSAPLPGIVTITDLESGSVIASLASDATQDSVEYIVPAGRSYRLDAQVRDINKSAMIAKTEANIDLHERIVFGNITLKTVDFGKYDIPFFVSGYYRPNTSSSLAELLARRETDLKQATYIEEIHPGSKRYEEYASYAQTVSSLFSTLSTSCLEDILPQFVSKGLPSEVIEFRITGYADPNPIHGSYLEDRAVSFVDSAGNRITLQSGEALDNTKLSGLRAVYSATFLDSLMTEATKLRHNEYNDLKDEKKIVFRCVAGGVSSGADQMAAKRRILVEVIRRQRMITDDDKGSIGMR